MSKFFNATISNGPRYTWMPAGASPVRVTRDGDNGLRQVQDTANLTYTATFNTPWTVVHVQGERFSGYGAAKMAAGDDWDPQVGVDLALARAFRSLADQVEASARIQ